MSMVGTKGTWIAALLLSAGLLGGTGLAAGAAPLAANHTVAQTTDNGAQCQTEAEDKNGNEQGDVEDENGSDQGAEDQDNVQDENGADDAAEGDTDADTAADEAAEESDTAAKPGELSEGQELLPKAKITVEAAVQAAQGSATGALGAVELEEKNGKLVFEVIVGDQEVFVDAADGTIVSADSIQQGAEDEAAC